MSITHGMNVDEVDQLGRLLQRNGDRLGQILGEIDSVLHAVVWEGHDAGVFKSEWWPKHKASVQTAAQQLHGFGQSALNNVTEQRSASGEGGRASLTSTAAAAPVIAAVGSVVAAGVAGAGSGALVGSERSWEAVRDAYSANGRGYGLGGYSAGGKFEYQCTAWANYRWRELGYQGPLVTGNGWQMAGNAGGSVTTQPTLVAMASYGGPPHDKYGHVMIVEEVRSSGGANSIRVSEMNMGANADVGTPDEYRASRWLVQRTDGTWAVDGTSRNVGSVRFAALPATKV